MGKGSGYGKYASQKQGIQHNYKFVGITKDGTKVVGANVQANSAKEGTRKAIREQGFKEVVKGSMIIATKFESIQENPPINKPMGSWDSGDWKSAKEADSERKKKKKV